MLSQSFFVVIFMILFGLTTSVCSQSVASRSASPDESGLADPEEGSGQSRSIFNHKHLSPHRMMHFGKRPLVQQAPAILTTDQVLDLYPSRLPKEVDQQQQQQQPDFPYTLYFPMRRDQVLEWVQQVEPYDPTARKGQLANVARDLLELELTKMPQKQRQKQQQQNCEQDQLRTGLCIQQQPSQLNSNKLMRLLSNAGAENQQGSSQLLYAKKQSSSSNDEQLPQVNGNTAAAGQQEEQSAEFGASNGQSNGDEINISSRSIAASGGGSLPHLTHAHLRLLYGRGQHIPSSQASLLNLGNFIKKAEPQRMTFMHFGR